MLLLLCACSTCERLTLVCLHHQGRDKPEAAARLSGCSNAIQVVQFRGGILAGESESWRPRRRAARHRCHAAAAAVAR